MKNKVVFPKLRWVVALAGAWAWLTFVVVVLTFSPMLPVMAREFGRRHFRTRRGGAEVFLLE